MSIAGPGWGFGIGLTGPPIPVVEYYNVHLDHYFLTIDGNEMADIESGKAGPGWVRTGFAFDAFQYPPRPAGCEGGDCGAPVSRFYGTPGRGPNSHFFTAFAEEAAGLKRPGSEWTFESTPFSIPLPIAGRCAEGLVPVYRFDNGRGAVNDDNHRYVADSQVREKMRARGWIEEGVAFCALGAAEVPLASYGVQRWRNRVVPGSQCEAEAQTSTACMAVDNLPVPDAPLQRFGVEPAGAEFFDKTGIDFAATDTLVVPGSSPPAAASNVFVQGGGDYATGIHVDTRGRGASALSSVKPMRRFKTRVAAGEADERFFPWVPHEDDIQLTVSFVLNVKRLDVRTPGGHAYGHPTIEFVDQRSGKHLQFTALTYGTVPQADIVMRDESNGHAIVGTTLRPENPYLRNLGNGTLALRAGFVSQAPAGFGGAFSFCMDRREFQRVIDAARRLEPALSTDPSDYLVASFQFKNEVSGDGEIGLNLRDLVLQLRRR